MTSRFIDHLPYGDHASRPAATAVPTGTLYSCTDHDLIYQSDGATWATWATGGGGGGSPASETVAGIAELATQAETNTGTDDERIVTPLKLQTRLAAYAQPLDAELSALAGLTSAADKLPYFTGSGTAAVTTLTSFIRTLLDDADAAAALATLGAVALSLVDAKGDLLVGSAADTLARLAVGSNGQVLTADSGETTGVKWATPSSGTRTLLDSVTLGSDTANVTFSSISGSYTHLELLVVGRSSAAASGDTVNVALNSDTTAGNYEYQRVYGNVSTAGASTTTSRLVGFMTANSDTANAPGILELSIPGYAGTTWHKLMRTRSGVTGTSSNIVQEMLSRWANTAAVTSIALTLGSGGNFKTGTKAWLYGLT